MAKISLSLPTIVNIPQELSEFKSSTRTFLHKKWQEDWDNQSLGPNKSYLHDIKYVIKNWDSANRNQRQEEIVLTRVRLGKGLFNTQHIFVREPHPECTNCGIALDFPHILLHCPLYHNQRRPIPQKLNLQNLPLNLGNILNDDFPQVLIITFLKKTDFFDKI